MRRWRLVLGLALVGCSGDVGAGPADAAQAADSGVADVLAAADATSDTATDAILLADAPIDALVCPDAGTVLDLRTIDHGEALRSASFLLVGDAPTLAQ